MDDTNIRVEIKKNNTSIYENKLQIPEKNQYNNLIESLRLTQQKVNDILTSLVEQERNDVSKDQWEDSLSDSDEDDDFDSQVNPKKSE